MPFPNFPVRLIPIRMEGQPEGFGALLRGSQKGGRRLISSDPERDFTEMGAAFEKVTVRWRMPRVILDLWSGQGHLSSYLQSHEPISDQSY